MITITKNKGNDVHYTCGCGTRGKCMIKPLKQDSTLVINLECPMCHETERIVLVQYTDEISKNKLLASLNDKEISWALILSNEVIINGT